MTRQSLSPLPSFSVTPGSFGGPIKRNYAPRCRLWRCSIGLVAPSCGHRRDIRERVWCKGDQGRQIDRLMGRDRGRWSEGDADRERTSERERGRKDAVKEEQEERKYEGEPKHGRIERPSFRNLPSVPFIPSRALLEEPRVRRGCVHCTSPILYAPPTRATPRS